ncbi:MAG: TIGR01777 family oxidoreductase [Candidatus Binatia bacterium]
MKIETFVHRTRIPAPADVVFRWHGQPGALERLTPPWESVEVVERAGGIQNGDRVVLRMRLGPLSQQWVAEHRDYQEGVQFRDVQISGPFAHWVHTHRMRPDGPAACYLEDQVEYALPLGVLGYWGGSAFVREKLERLFTYRHRVTVDDVTAHARWTGKAMKILVTGASGLVGSALVPFLTTGGHQVFRLVRSKPVLTENEVLWEPMSGVGDFTRLEGLDAVVHLAGENIAAGRWTDEQKARIRDSRVRGTKVLSEALSQLVLPPKVLVSASAIGYYGNRGTEMVSEESPPGSSFLAEVCTAWEEATAPAEKAGIRVVHGRVGVVLSPKGGALAKMLLPFKLGAGGHVGSGQQYMSWIALDDVVGALFHAVITDTLRGPVNLTTPQAVTNREFTAILGKVLRRPTLLPVPAFAVRVVLGEMAEELLLAGTRVAPRQLVATGYEFRFPQLKGALRHVLGRPEATC